MPVAAGIVAGVCSALAYGSFAGWQALNQRRGAPAVPIKAPQVVEAKVHPLVFQSYKSLMCFLSAWLLLLWADFRFAPWALLAAVIWVANGILAIVSIHLAGLGVAQTIWSSVSVFVSFAWGKAYFREPIANLPLTVLGLLLMVAGMLGLGYIASRADPSSLTAAEPRAAAAAVVSEIFAARPGPAALDGQRTPGKAADAEERAALVGAGVPSSAPVSGAAAGREAASGSTGDEESPGPRSPSSTFESEGGGQGKAAAAAAQPWWHARRFALGVGGSVLIGCLAGSMMVCLKLSPPGRQGDQYTMSFGIGVALVTLALLAAYHGACACLGRRGPSFQPRVAAGPACLAGLLWSLGNYLSVLAVDSLGMAIGWPLVQCSLLVSNLWALFWYREIQGPAAALGFLACAAVILAGVAMLACFGL